MAKVEKVVVIGDKSRYQGFLRISTSRTIKSM
jgi:hypothetical protein